MPAALWVFGAMFEVAASIPMRRPGKLAKPPSCSSRFSTDRDVPANERMALMSFKVQVGAAQSSVHEGHTVGTYHRARLSQPVYRLKWEGRSAECCNASGINLLFQCGVYEARKQAGLLKTLRQLRPSSKGIKVAGSTR
jgi:hypothetical protein